MMLSGCSRLFSARRQRSACGSWPIARLGRFSSAVGTDPLTPATSRESALWQLSTRVSLLGQWAQF
eukprot:1096803-Alexandrium_andersonii.AAC.1